MPIAVRMMVQLRGMTLSTGKRRASEQRPCDEQLMRQLGLMTLIVDLRIPV